MDALGEVQAPPVEAEPVEIELSGPVAATPIFAASLGCRLPGAPQRLIEAHWHGFLPASVIEVSLRHEGVAYRVEVNTGTMAPVVEQLGDSGRTISVLSPKQAIRQQLIELVRLELGRAAAGMPRRR